MKDTNKSYCKCSNRLLNKLEKFHSKTVTMEFPSVKHSRCMGDNGNKDLSYNYALPTLSWHGASELMHSTMTFQFTSGSNAGKRQ